MSQFTTKLVDKQIDENKWIVLESFEYHIGEYPSDEVITVPIGFITDYASFPKFLHKIFPPKGEYDKAAVLHDYCYKTACYGKFKSDLIFLEAMGVLKIVSWKKYMMYVGVFIFGWYSWIKHRLNKKEVE